MRTIRPTAFGPVPLICNSLYQHSRALSQTGSMAEMEKERKEKGEREKEEERGREEMRYALGDRLSSIKVTSAPISQEVVEFMRYISVIFVAKSTFLKAFVS